MHAQSCLILCDPTDCSLLGSPVHWISQVEYWSGLPVPPTGDLDLRIEPAFSVSPALAGRFFTTLPLENIHSNVK